MEQYQRLSRGSSVTAMALRCHIPTEAQFGPYKHGEQILPKAYGQCLPTTLWAILDRGSFRRGRCLAIERDGRGAEIVALYHKRGKLS